MNDFVKLLTKERNRLLRLIASIDSLLNEYSQSGSDVSGYRDEENFNPLHGIESYKLQLFDDISVSKGYSLKESVKNVVLGLDRFSKVRDIIKILLLMYPEKRDNMLNFQVQVSGILSDWGKKGVISKYQFSPSKKDTAWGKNEWLSPDDKPFEEYMPKLN